MNLSGLIAIQNQRSVADHEIAIYLREVSGIITRIGFRDIGKGRGK